MILEQDILKKCLEGDSKAQETLYNRFAPSMLGVCCRYFKTIEEAEDALQEGFIKVFANLKKFRGEGSLQGWIRRVIINTALNEYRSNQKHYFHSDIHELEEFIIDESKLGDKFDVEDLLKLVQNMPDGYRVVFNLYEVEGYSHKEIAAMLKISKNTSKSQLLKARKYLQKEITKLSQEQNYFKINAGK